MPLIHALPVAVTVPGTDRPSATVSYNGTSDRSVAATVLCPTWATTDPAITVTIRVQQSFDGGASWEDFGVLQVPGRTVSRHGEMPAINVQVTDGLGPRLARIVLSVDGGTLSVGVDIVV